MKKVLSFICDLPKKAVDTINTNRSSFILITVCSFLLNIILEAALRKSFSKAFALIYKAPVPFFFNMLIVLACYSIIYLVKHRTFVFSLNTILWLTVAAVSRCLMGFRTTPFNASDFRVIKSAITIIPVYLEVWQIIGIALLTVIAIWFLVYTFIKAPKSKESSKFSAIIAAIVITFTSSCTAVYLSIAFDTEHFSNLPTAYKNHGFNICFLCSIFDHGIEKPKGYSVKTVDNIVSTLESNLDCITDSEEDTQTGSDAVSAPTKEHPNIIFIQLESFYDVNNIEGYTYSQNPIPVYTSLKNTCPGGLLTVPSIGAGTCNTEFEVITGMEVSYFGVAEYPYLSVLQDNTCESIAYNTKHLGYTSHAIHNHKGTFYDRHKVFPNLGFETFTSLENMPDIQKNKRNWARDSMLTNNILLALDSTPEGRDIVYTISVQPHGRYPSKSAYEKLLDGEMPKITVSGNEDNSENPGFCYYVNELHEADAFIGSLLSEIISRNEPTVVVMFGDHLPAFTVQRWNVTDGNYYTTDYIIWNNCGLDFSDAPDMLYSYQLSSFVFKVLGITEGSMNKLNQAYIGTDSDYSNERQMLEYDMLYGKRAALGEINKYVPVDTEYGLAEISMSSMIAIDGRTYIKGNNFNQNSTVTINGKLRDTEFIDKNTICLDGVPVDGDIISVVQLAANHTVLGGADNELIFTGNMIIRSEMQDTDSSQATEPTEPQTTVTDEGTEVQIQPE